MGSAADKQAAAVTTTLVPAELGMFVPQGNLLYLPPLHPVFPPQLRDHVIIPLDPPNLVIAALPHESSRSSICYYKL